MNTVFPIALLAAEHDPRQLVYALLLSVVLGVWVALLYRFTQVGRMLSPSLQNALVLLCMVSAMVMMVIGDSLARAFSLVGALAIIRFRTRLRSPWDIGFVFLALAAGIGCGVMAWRAAMVGVGVVSLAVVSIGAFPLSGVRGEINLLRVDLSAFEGTEARIATVLDEQLARRVLEQACTLRFGEVLSYRYRVILREGRTIEGLIRQLSEVEGVERVVLNSAEEGLEDSE